MMASKNRQTKVRNAEFPSPVQRRSAWQGVMAWVGVGIQEVTQAHVSRDASYSGFGQIPKNSLQCQ